MKIIKKNEKEIERNKEILAKLTKWMPHGLDAQCKGDSREKEVSHQHAGSTKARSHRTLHLGEDISWVFGLLTLNYLE